MDVEALRKVRGLQQVTIRTARLKYRGLLPHAFRYAIWAVQTGGRIIVEDEPHSQFAWYPHQFPFMIVRYVAARFMLRDAIVIRCDNKSGVIEFERTSQPTEPGWAAGIVFSGDDAEIPGLLQCIAALQAQAELSYAGAITICGPARNLDFLAPFPGVTYLEYEPPETARVTIAHKKNFLANSLAAPRFIILHARILLEPGALAALGDEFDFTTPLVRVNTTHGSENYLCYGVSRSVSTALPPVGSVITLIDRNERAYLDLLAKGAPYIDGGVFAARKAAFLDCPLNPCLAWGEAEDFEWCLRAFDGGHLVDMCVDSRAVSATNKNRHRVLFSHVPPGIQAAVRSAASAGKAVINSTLDATLQIMGKR